MQEQERGDEPDDLTDSLGLPSFPACWERVGDNAERGETDWLKQCRRENLPVNHGIRLLSLVVSNQWTTVRRPPI